MEPVDELVFARWIIPVEPKGLVFEDHAVAITGGTIVDVLPASEARERYQAAQETVLESHLLTPGLINLHTHAAMTLMRGVGDDMALMNWLEERIWPLEQSLLSEEFVLAGSRLACGEMLRGGVTCFNDMYFFAEATARAVEEYGMRACLGITVLEFGSAFAPDAAGYLERGLALRDRLRDHPLITFSLAPHAPYTVSDESFARIVTLAEQIGLPVHLHLHETQAEIDQELAKHHLRPVERMAQLGVLGPNLIAVHCVHLSQSEIELFARHGVTLVHCPASNLKLGSGIAPIAQALAAGVAVGIGTDGAASNNRLDMLAEMRLAALLAKGASRDAEAFDAATVLESATLTAARALQIDHLVGSLVKGKRADMVAFDVSPQDMQPIYDIAAHLIFVLGRECVSDVWVDGRLVVQKRQLLQRTARQAEAEGASALPLWQNRLKIRIGSLS